MTARKGRHVQLAKIEMRRRLTLIGAMLLKSGEVDGPALRHLGRHRDPPALTSTRSSVCAKARRPTPV
jgi:hypothetical protein